MKSIRLSTVKAVAAGTLAVSMAAAMAGGAGIGTDAVHGWAGGSSTQLGTGTPDGNTNPGPA